MDGRRCCQVKPTDGELHHDPRDVAKGRFVHIRLFEFQLVLRLGHVKRGRELASVHAIVHSYNVSQASTLRHDLRVMHPISDAYAK